ncbi:chanoclavine-I dehydrogenase [Setomelanomma holmii]|uniref:Chanoclavine-I dehydrogenase n=1 Tax=Setomelanomma holmii TaxID=210430 RepID=A0A9P4GWJ4_9PLEO|nr:chanoclavine-I dehydrogenase [Setomelanomma holmii]
MESLAGKVFTVSGGGSGMGLATCRLLAQSGARAISIGDFQEANFETIKKELQAINASTKIQTVKVDVASSSSVASWMQEVISAFGALDGCVNAAGVAQPVGVRKAPALLEETDETWRRTMGINLDGVFFCTREQVRAMVALPKAPRSIVNIASIAALIHAADTYAYSTSKNAVVHLSQAMSKDGLPFGIRINALSPGATATPMLAQFFVPSDESAPVDTQGWALVQPEDIAKAAGWLLCDHSIQVSGINMVVGPGAP